MMNMMAGGFSVPGFKTLNANGHLIHYAEQGAGWRYDTLLEKEPETIEWIDTFRPGETLWDIGANVGIYSIYAGVKGIRTVAFEPHFANYHQLCTTVAVNRLQDMVTPLCLAFAERKSVSMMNLASLEIGTSMSNFGAALDFRGNAFEPAFRQGMIGYDLDSFVEDFGVEIPDHIKIDVDGIELAIVTGAQKTLANPKVQSVSIELIETDIAQVDAVTEIMERAGLHFVHKKQNIAFATADTTDVLNYLYHRDPAALAARFEEARGATAPAAVVREDEDVPVTTDELVARIVQRIRAAEIDNVPTANIFMEDMLPVHVYRELLARLPHDSALDPIIHPDAITADGKRTRYLLDLTAESLERLQPEDQPFWEAMIAVFTAPEITRAIVEKYEPALRARFGDAMPELIAVPILYRDFPGYRIGIHQDTPRKIATMQFYLPEDESQLHLGTTFHCRTGDSFQRHKTNAFAPNSAYSFVRSEESWHSVDELGPDEKVRNTIALTFYIKGQEYRSDPMSATAAAAAAPVQSEVYDAEIRQALQDLAKTFKRPEDIASLFRVDGTGVELGVGTGELSERILARADIGHLYSIAPWCGEYGQGVEQYREAIVRLNPHRSRNTILRMQSNDALSLFGDGALDFLYINGFAHDGERDGQLLRTWFAKLRSGGIVAGDDYAAQWPLVVTAVSDFAAAYGLEVHMAFCEDEPGRPGHPAWFAMKP